MGHFEAEKERFRPPCCVVREKLRQVRRLPHAGPAGHDMEKRLQAAEHVMQPRPGHRQAGLLSLVAPLHRLDGGAQGGPDVDGRAALLVVRDPQDGREHLALVLVGGDGRVVPQPL